MNPLQKQVKEVIAQVGQAVYGKDREIIEIMAALIGGGHILLEDIPGVGKTTLAVAFSKAMKLDYKRIQFTPDVLPSDLTGFSIYRRETEEFVYQPGTVFCNLLLADELNRTSPKTQSALLEVMEEKRVTAEGITRDVPRPFTVVATQNPTGAAGTQLLPGAQIDRFMISMSVGYPDFESELQMAMGVSGDKRVDNIMPVMTADSLLYIQKEVDQIYICKSIYRYILELVRATRTDSYIEQGGSPRATIALVKMARAQAWLEGREFVTPNDVMEQYPFIMKHRIQLNSSARMSHMKKEIIIQRILDYVKKPPLEEHK